MAVNLKGMKRVNNVCAVFFLFAQWHMAMFTCFFVFKSLQLQFDVVSLALSLFTFHSSILFIKLENVFTLCVVAASIWLSIVSCICERVKVLFCYNYLHLFPDYNHHHHRQLNIKINLYQLILYTHTYFLVSLFSFSLYL